MLRQFIQDCKNLYLGYILGEYGKIETILEGLALAINFLQSPKKFPNEKINQLIRLFASIIMKEYINYLVISTEPNAKFTEDAISFILQVNDEDRSIEFPLLIIRDNNFLSKLQKNPIDLLPQIIETASQISDFYSRRIINEDPEITARRQKAWLSETILTLMRLGSQEEIEIYLNEGALSIIRSHPEGLNSLPYREMIRANPLSYKIYKG